MDFGPIDLVYCWCDQNDPAFAAAKKDCMAALGKKFDLCEANAGDCRYVSNDELKYALRSISFGRADFIRRVHVVMADFQTPPPWLRLDNPKLRIVRHGEFIPRERLPTFNSTSIEFHLPYIKGLAERFLYANDDMFVVSRVTPDFFYAIDGKPYFRYLDSSLDIDATHESGYINKIANSKRLIRATFGLAGDFKKSVGHLPHHNVDAYVKSDLLSFAEHFSKELAPTLASPLRSSDQLQRDAWASFALATGRGHYRRSRRPWYETMFGGCHRESWYVSLGKKNLMKSLRRIKPKLMCVNDNPNASGDDRASIRDFLESVFPEPSPFEK